MRSFMVSIVAGLLAVLSLNAVAAALADGTLNGWDYDGYGWPGGDDNPDSLQGSYCYYNSRHDAQLYEWNEPGHDRYKDWYMMWAPTAEQKLNNDEGSKQLTYEQNITDQDYYNYTGVFTTNLPHTSNPEAEGWFEEWVQGYSEVDMELRHTSWIVADIDYLMELRWDAEKPPTSTRPVFNSECEYENLGGGNLQFDRTGTFRKKTLMQ